jgi:hypothetical protein
VKYDSYENISFFLLYELSAIVKCIKSKSGMVVKRYYKRKMGNYWSTNKVLVRHSE